MIRQATIKDASALAKIGFIVLKDLYQPLARNSKQQQQQQADLEILVQQQQVAMSYKFAHVYVENAEILGVIWAYQYHNFPQLKENLYQFSKVNNLTFPQIEEEARASDYYIDTIAVLEKARNQEIGRKLLDFCILSAQNCNYQVISLIVEAEKTSAQKLYQSRGFKHEKTSQLYGGTYQYCRLNLEK
ncbi:MAG: GNAT family N-acetyltransferase [Culicoidibacterales bacterium]